MRVRPTSSSRPIHMFGVVAVAVAVACVFLPETAAASPDNELACELVSLAKAEKAFSLPNARSEAKATSPTAAGPNNHTVEGSDQSECDVYLYRTFPSPAVLISLVHNADKPNVPTGIGSVIVTTNVRDDSNAGDNGEHWDPDAYFGRTLIVEAALQHKFGGGNVALPKYGGDRDGAWIGNQNHAIGIWEIGDGVITINVLASGGTAPARLVALAKLLVPKFAPFASP